MGKAVSWAPIPLRLMLGVGMAYHGYPKLFDSDARAGFEAMLKGIGVPMENVMSWVVGILEFGGGIAIVLGAFVGVVSLLMIIEMLVAMFTVHWQSGFNFMNITGKTPDGQFTFGMPGYEVNLLYIAGFLSLLLSGAGALSVDGSRRKAMAA